MEKREKDSFTFLFYQSICFVAIPFFLSGTLISAPLQGLYSYSSKVVASSTLVPGSTDLVNFPLLIDIEANNELKTSVNGGKLESASGYDIAFGYTLSSDEGEKLKIYIEKYNGLTGELSVWVQLNLNATADTEFYMFYGRSGATDPSTSEVFTDINYTGVWHLSQTPGSNAVVDATGNSGNGSAFGNVAIDPNGAVGQAYTFDGSGDYVTIPDNSTIEPSGDFTISCWFKSNGAQSSYAKMFAKGRLANPYASYTLEMRPNATMTTYNREIGFQTGRLNNTYTLTDSNGNGYEDIQDGEWYFFSGTIRYTGVTYEQTVYLNGVQVSASSNSSGINYYNPTDYPLTIGGIYDGSINNAFHGTIDQLTLSNVARSPDYFNAEMRNLACGSAFISVENIAVNCNLPEVLPIKLSEFTVTRQHNQALIRWITQSEKNNDYFTLEKSQNGRNFKEIAKIPGAVNHQGPLQYEFTDTQPYSNTSYYRLKQTDLDGSFTYSKVIYLTFKDAASQKLSIYPNPASNRISVKFDSPSEIILRIQMINSTGFYQDICPKRLKDGEIFHEEINIHNLANGVYIVIVETDKNVYRQRLVVGS